MDDGQQFYLYANWLHNNDMANWKDWHCEAGVTRLMIDKNLQIWSGDCRNDFLGHVDQEWELFQHHTICQRSTCSACTDDLLTKKWKKSKS